MKSATAGITTIGSDLLDSGINHATDIKPHDHKVCERFAEATQAIQTPPTTRPYPAICSASSGPVGTLKTPGLVSVWQLLRMFDRAFDRGSHLSTCFEALKTPKTP